MPRQLTPTTESEIWMLPGLLDMPVIHLGFRDDLVGAFSRCAVLWAGADCHATLRGWLSPARLTHSISRLRGPVREAILGTVLGEACDIGAVGVHRIQLPVQLPSHLGPGLAIRVWAPGHVRKSSAPLCEPSRGEVHDRGGCIMKSVSSLPDNGGTWRVPGQKAWDSPRDARLGCTPSSGTESCLAAIYTVRCEPPRTGVRSR